MVDSFSMAEFRDAARRWVDREDRDPRLPTTSEEFVRDGYDAWLAEADTKRRTQAQFDLRLKHHFPQLHVTSQYRKLKGQIKPEQNELSGFLTVFFEDEADRAEIVERLVRLLLDEHTDLLDDLSAAWVWASAGSLILGPDERWREQEFRSLMGERLDEVRKKVSNPAGVPISIWAIDVTHLWGQGEDAFYARRGVSVLASVLMAALASKLPPPLETPTLQVTRTNNEAIPELVSIGPKGRSQEADLRSILKRTSVICLLGLPADSTHSATKESELEFRGDGDPRTFFVRALMPESIVTRDRLEREAEDGRERAKILRFAESRSLCLGHKLSLETVKKIAQESNEPVSGFAGWDAAQLLHPLHTLFYFDDRVEVGNDRTDAEAGIRAVTFSRYVTPHSMKTALWAIISAAATHLQHHEGARKKNNTVGAELVALMRRQGVKFLSIEEFLDFRAWYLDEPDQISDAKTREQD